MLQEIARVFYKHQQTTTTSITAVHKMVPMSLLLFTAHVRILSTIGFKKKKKNSLVKTRPKEISALAVKIEVRLLFYVSITILQC